MLKYLSLALGAFNLCLLPLFAEVSMGEKLETQMWEDMKHRNYTAVENNIADQFQSLHTFGALTRSGEIELIKDLYLGSYEISNVKVTENGDTLVVTYLISVAEKISNQSLSDKPAPRMSVWQKIKGKWQWIAHVNLKQIPTEKPKSAPIVAPKIPSK